METLQAARQPVAFLSYAHFDDYLDRGRITRLGKRLSDEIRMQSGEEFPIFQDRTSIEWGQNWTSSIEESLAACCFLIPIITPNYFASDACLDELERFLLDRKSTRLN